MEMSDNWRLETLKLKDLKPHPNNPRTLSKHEALQLEESLRKFGCVEKPIINKDGTIIGGHQRVTLLKKKKVKEFPCWISITQLSDKEVDEFNIRLNRNHGSFDYDILANHQEVGDLIEWGFEAKDFDVKPMTMSDDIPVSTDSSEDHNICPTCGKKNKAKQ